MKYTLSIVTFALLAASAASAPAQNADPMSSCPMHARHAGRGDASHADAVDANGDTAMGFSHLKTTHRFRLFVDGGAIEVSANDAADAESREQIRSHLREIARAFSRGRFDTPKAVHGRVPPGVPTMERHAADIAYRYEPTASGGRVRITTKNRDALDAVHDFLRFQIEDHRTGDPTDRASEP